MNKILLVLVPLFIFTGVNAQWTQVNTGLTNLQVTSMFAYLDTIMIGTNGGGIFKSLDNGNSWSSINGDLPNTSIKDIRGGGGSKVIWVSTSDGAYFTMDHLSYTQASAGLPTTDINYYWIGSGDGETDWAIGTNGNGVFTSDDLFGPWAERNIGLSGDALIINDITGYNDDDVDYAAIATNNGVLYSTDSMRTWEDISGSLTGGQLKVNKLMMISFLVLVATDAGYYATMDFGETWLDGITGEQMNLIGFSYPGPGGFYYLMGENAYYSLDLSTWNPIDLTGVTGGYITATAVSSNYLYIGTETGGVFRRELDQITSVNEIVEKTIPENFILKQNYPNPFNPSTKIEFSIAPTNNSKEGVQTLLVVYDILGKKVKTLINNNLQPGNYSIDFDAAGLTSGIYFYSIYAGNFTQTNKMILTK